MKKLLGILVLGLLLGGCTPDPTNLIGMDTSWIKPLTFIFLFCSVVVGIFLIVMFVLDKKNSPEKPVFDFWGGLSFLVGPGLIATICFFTMAITGFLIVTFYSNLVVTIIILFIALGIIMSFISDRLDKKK